MSHRLKNSGNLDLDITSMGKYSFLLVAIGPAFIGYLIFTLYPNILSVFYSFLNWDGIGKIEFVGLDNFKILLKDRFFWKALGHNFILLIFIPILTISISLILAYLVSNNNIIERKILKLIFFFPNIISTIVVALLWQFIYDGQYGMLNQLLEIIGINTNNLYWLGDENTALWAVIPAWIWGSIGLYVIIYSNAIETISESYYEAARIEGANDWIILTRITIPTIMPIVELSYLFLVLQSIKAFGLIMVLTNGGPGGSSDVAGLYMFNLAFGGAEGRNYGYASAMGVALLIILLIIRLSIYIIKNVAKQWRKV